MSLPQQTTILIVGAGPCGMATALSLNHQGIHDIVIVDALLAGENSSRALVIQAATLEALNDIGCLDDLLSIGDKPDTLDIHHGSSRLISIDFSLLAPHTKFPFTLVIPQTNTEAVMLGKLDQLGIKVFRPFKVVSVKPSESVEEGMFEVRFASGEMIKTKYVVGADGAHSAVRNEAGVSFKDPDGDEKQDYGNLSQLVLGDVTFTSPPQIPTKTLGTFSHGNFSLFAQFPDKASPDPTCTVYRVVSSVPVEDGTAPQAPSAEYLQALLDRYGPPALSSDPAVNAHPTRIDRLYWSSRYRTRSAIVDRYFTLNPNGGGAILLLGDAAHIHSPVGGQGMSLGIRDAISLGPVLKAHIDSRDSTSSSKHFEEWGAIRRRYAITVIAMTKEALGMMTASRRVWAPLLMVGFSVLRFLGRFRFMKQMVAYRISGLADI
ncbi:FAD-binding-3 domain-containing protein [Mycena sanguinolenta]|uniref:FAD-binding-3 domain-containing protein n=1 Tax=Mycena sanguinolenta TaxID=230812 RepID=A0A8H6YSA2_9AGAR|nr:FAD-binding-3 domain-containing protein [Mycena sanguinolenta]